MYLIRFVPNFGVFCVFLWISRLCYGAKYQKPWLWAASFTLYKLATKNLQLANIFLQLVAKRRHEDFFYFKSCVKGEIETRKKTTRKSVTEIPFKQIHGQPYREWLFVRNLFTTNPEIHQQRWDKWGTETKAPEGTPEQYWQYILALSHVMQLRRMMDFAMRSHGNLLTQTSMLEHFRML